MTQEMSWQMEKYFSEIDKEVKRAYSTATKARAKGFDPESTVGMPLAKNMAERVEGIVGAMIPQIIDSGVSKIIQELEKKYKKSDWRVALIVSLEVAKEKFCKFKDEVEAMETGIRVGIAYLTLGIVASPLEGFIQLKIAKRADGKDYFCLMYSGPIRSAGGTAGAVSVVVADYIRKKMGYEAYDPTEKEIKRTVTELYDYHDRVTNLQYLPSEEEIEYIVRHLPVQVSGDPSEKIEVSNYKDLERIETNQIRSGVCLVIGECLSQKASKVWKNISQWAKEFELEHWSFLEGFLKLQKKVKAQNTEQKKEGKVSPVFTYIQDLVACRPVLTHPLAAGGFRLRYGRSRTSGYSAASIHPATMHALNRFIAIGTQLKAERPGKASAISACDSIEGPVVKLNNGDVIRISSSAEAKKYTDQIKEILFLGVILFNYSDFFNRAHQLLPPGYCEEWWALEAEHATVDFFGSLDFEKVSSMTEIPAKRIEDLFSSPLSIKPNFAESITISKSLRIPLHPKFIFHWKTISKEYFLLLLEWLKKAEMHTSEGFADKIVLPVDEAPKRVLELLGVEHLVVNSEYVVMQKDTAAAFAANIGMKETDDVADIIESVKNSEDNALHIANSLAGVTIRDKSGIFIGARMGRPEKAKMRKLTGSPHALFPVGDEGGRLRSVQSALEAKKITAEFTAYRCKSCGKDTIYAVCEGCGRKTDRIYFCRECGQIDTEECKKHGQEVPYRRQEIDIGHYFQKAVEAAGLSTAPDLVKGVKGTSNKEHVPEHLVKGILRAKYSISVNKDGTTRYDMTQLPITHFKPKEVRASVEKLRQLGYEKDIKGKELTDTNQILELKPQDVILPASDENPEDGADKIMYNTGRFVDDLLQSLYCLEPYYNFNSEDDVIGSLALALAPHTSAGIVCRIIGFSKTQGFLAHPMLHAATRRDCDGDEASVILLMDALVNFSRKYIPDTRGATQDAPLVLTSRIIPSEVDDMAFDMDIAWRYPLEFYEACMQYKMPWEVKIDQLGNHLETERQYEGLGFTHSVENLNSGVRCSAYKILPSMEEKLKGQMLLADIIRAVDAPDVARLVIEKHFIRDIKGNLRKFSMQQFRCVNCNEKFRRPPLARHCPKCRGRIIFTITEGSIIKYLEPAISLAEKYNLPPYLKQTLEITRRNVESIFGREKEKQTGLGAWFA